MADEGMGWGNYVNNLSRLGRAITSNLDGTLSVEACHLVFVGLTDDTRTPTPGRKSAC